MRAAAEVWEGAGRERGLRGEGGAASLAITLGLVLIMTLMGLAFLVYARRQSSLVGADQDSALALYAAEAGFERARRDIENAWRGYLGARANKAEHQLRWFKCSKLALQGQTGTCDANAFTGNNVYDPSQRQNVNFPQVNPTAKYSVAVGYDYTDVPPNDTGNYVNAIITVSGHAGSTNKEKIVEGVVRFEVAPSQVFNYAYFINNRATIDIGAGSRINGNVRANGNINVISGVVNGEIIAGVNTDIGSGNGQPGEGCVENPNSIRWDDTTTYRGALPTAKRPAKPGT